MVGRGRSARPVLPLEPPSDVVAVHQHAWLDVGQDAVRVGWPRRPFQVAVACGHGERAVWNRSSAARRCAGAAEPGQGTRLALHALAQARGRSCPQSDDLAGHAGASYVAVAGRAVISGCRREWQCPSPAGDRPVAGAFSCPGVVRADIRLLRRLYGTVPSWEHDGICPAGEGWLRGGGRDQVSGLQPE